GPRGRRTGCAPRRRPRRGPWQSVRVRPPGSGATVKRLTQPDLGELRGGRRGTGEGGGGEGSALMQQRARSPARAYGEPHGAARDSLDVLSELARPAGRERIA